TWRSGSRFSSAPLSAELRRASAIVVSLPALLGGMLWNAPVLHKSAQIQPDGWKRDVALAVTKPLDAASGALLLDRPRRALKAALGRSSDDDIDTGVVVPEPPSEPVGTTPPGESLLRAAAGNPVLEPVATVAGRIASELARPDVFNWFRHIREQLRALEPEAVVVMFGGNDDHGFMTGLPEGVGIGSSAARAGGRNVATGSPGSWTR
ncbi:MAG TPA: hypothetical protein VK926_01200, partial [Gaiellaceae bacterium]|nr:hypothetical protein [Gaiellaceae bacterium]